MHGQGAGNGWNLFKVSVFLKVHLRFVGMLPVPHRGTYRFPVRNEVFPGEERE